MIKDIYRFLNPKFQNLALDYKVDLKPRYGHGKPPHGPLYALLDAHRDAYAELLTEVLALKPFLTEFRDSTVETRSDEPTWNNGFLPGLDIAVLYTLLTEYAPAKYIEIGSGNSTKVAARARRDQGLATQIISIDPAPRADVDTLADEVIREPFEDIDYDLVGALGDGDVLFVDNSHRILPNSDATAFFLEILPRLQKGVIVHVHDVYLPYDYPPFMCERGYSEQYGLAMYLLANPGKYRPLLPNYFVSEDETLASVVAPLWDHPNLAGVERHGGSFWLQIEE